MSAIRRWRDCYDFQDLLVMNKYWMLEVITDRNKYDEKSVQRPYPTPRDLMWNERGFLVRRSFEGKQFESKEDEFKCTYKQRACLEGIMQHDHAIKLFDTLKEDNNLLMIVMECEDGPLPTHTICKNFTEKIPLRMVPFDSEGIMLNAIKDKFKFDIMSEFLMGWIIEKKMGCTTFKAMRAVTDEDTQKLKKFKTQVLGVGNHAKRKRQIYPDIEEMSIASLTSFIPAKESDEVGLAQGNALYARFMTMKNTVSVTIMDKQWGRDDYLWMKLAQVL